MSRTDTEKGKNHMLRKGPCEKREQRVSLLPSQQWQAVSLAQSEQGATFTDMSLVNCVPILHKCCIFQVIVIKKLLYGLSS